MNSSKIKKGLGRGLSSLIGETKIENSKNKLLISELIPNKYHHQLIKLVNDRPGHDRRYAIDSSLIQNELKWSPSISFSEGLEHTVRWYLKNASWLDKSIVN